MSQVEVVGVDQESPADEARAEAIDRPQVEAETVVEVPSDQMGQQEQCEVEASVVSEEENAEPVSAEESNAGEETVEAESVEPVTAEVEDTEVEIAAATSGEELSGEEVSRKDEAFRHKDVEVPRPSNENGLSGDDSAQVDLAALHIHLARFDFGQIQNVVDHFQQQSPTLLDVRCVAELFFVQRLDALQHFGKTDDAVQRCPQFMAHVCQEVTLQPIGLIKLQVQLSQLVDP